MRELLSADWYMLRKHGLIWWLLACVLGIGALILVSNGLAVNDGYEFDFEESQITLGSILAGAAAALLCGVSMDNAFTEGTIRNKIATGKSRSQVYWASYLTCTLAALLIYGIYALVVFLGERSLAAPDDPARTTELIFYGVCTIPAYTAMYFAVSVMVGRKGIGVVCIVTFVVLGIIAIWLQQSLAEPEQFDVYDWEQMTYEELLEDDAEFSAEEVEIADRLPRIIGTEPNPNYVAEPARSAYKFFLNVLPTGQSLELLSEVESVLPWYALGFCVLFCGIGVFFMNRRNIN